MRLADDQIRLIRANPSNPRYQWSKVLSVWTTDDADLTGSHGYYFTMGGGSWASSVGANPVRASPAVLAMAVLAMAVQAEEAAR